MKIIGFTLFWNPTKKKWQKSVRYEEEDGWFVEHISDEMAQRFFRAVVNVGQAEMTCRHGRPWHQDCTACIRGVLADQIDRLSTAIEEYTDGMA
jgi:hypothetical protein